MINYILIWRNNISKGLYSDTGGEYSYTQHRILTMDIDIKNKKIVKPRRRKQQIKWWRLKDRDENRKFASKVEEKIKDINEWNQLEALLLDTVKSVLGQTTGKGAYNEKEAWWWNEEVQNAVKEKRLKFKRYQNQNQNRFIRSYYRPRRPLLRPYVVAVAEATWKKVNVIPGI